MQTIFSSNFSYVLGTPINSVGLASLRVCIKLPYKASFLAKVNNKGLFETKSLVKSAIKPVIWERGK